MAEPLQGGPVPVRLPLTPRTAVFPEIGEYRHIHAGMCGVPQYRQSHPHRPGHVLVIGSRLGVKVVLLAVRGLGRRDAGTGQGVSIYAARTERPELGWYSPTMPKVVVTDASYPHLDRERAVAARHGAQFVAAQCKSSEDVLKAVSGADVVLVQYARITDEVLARMAPNAVVVRYGLGLDNIDLRAAERRGVRVAYVPDYATSEVADHTVALMLTALRKIIALDRSVRAGAWDASAVCTPMPSFSQAAVGFVGFGRIGRQVYERLKPFGFAALVSDPFAAATELQTAGATSAPLDELFMHADVITLHAPLTNDTRHIVNASRLSAMKRTAVIINTARGALIDTVALEHALANNHIAGAALDVFEHEPLPAESRLRALPNVILTPHAAWYSEAAAERVQALAADEVDRALSGKPPRRPALLT